MRVFKDRFISAPFITRPLICAPFISGMLLIFAVFEALPNAFWNNPALPEFREADELMAKLLATHLGS